MKLKINGFENEVIFKEDNVNILQIKNKTLLQNILEIISDLNNGMKNLEIQLISDENNEMKFENNVFVLTDLYNIDINSKSILSKIYCQICKNIKLDNQMEIEKNMYEIRNKIIEEANELPFEFVMKDEIDINDILKIYGLKIDLDNYKNILNRIELVIDLLSTLNVAKILIIPNLKSILNDRQLVELYKYSLYNKINLLLIESGNFEKLDYEDVMQIDEYFDDIIL